MKQPLYDQEGKTSFPGQRDPWAANGEQPSIETVPRRIAWMFIKGFSTFTGNH
jgi:hypothetical protein